MSDEKKPALPEKHVLHILLDDMGFSLHQLAASIGYPVAAVRAFRLDLLDGDEVTREEIRLKLHDIAILTARLGRHRGKTSGNHEEAALFEATVLEGYTTIGWDLYSYPDGARCAAATDHGLPFRLLTHRGIVLHPGHSALCELAQGAPAERVLDRHVPDWRTRFHTDYEVFEASDGHKSIRPKGA